MSSSKSNTNYNAFLSYPDMTFHLKKKYTDFTVIFVSPFRIYSIHSAEEALAETRVQIQKILF